MAVRLDRETLTRNRSRYRWDEWLDGTAWQGRQGTPEQVALPDDDPDHRDFTCKVTSFVSQLYKAAYDRGLRVEVHPKPDGVVEWEAYEPDENEQADSNSAA
jgi:hypothetical protein